MIVPAKVRLQRREELSHMCRKLFLSQQLVQLCEQATPKQEEFLCEALALEVESRERSRRTRLLNRARFPMPKSLEGYDYSHVRIPPSITKGELESCDFIDKKTNLVCHGPVGTGKTHLAIALGIKACERGFKVRFYTVTELVLKLAEARKGGTLERLVSDIRRLDLLILDEWGYVPVDKEGSQLLFRIISDSYESKSLILTTNLEFSKWGGIFTDQQMAAAMIDRLIHHGHLLLFEGQSYRMEHALMRKAEEGRANGR
ncbi:IS21-like element helper ATPase IstB [Sphaerochaeta halotolerans]|jgi:DNA replication protein DnaC|uniref:IS21-like element helper ATPase IstB n=1 Tax=Sphaerochaeta halotolerans TaxID=2293840 RepID=UPI00136EADDA|nr:IS21-like element helper ATPase IstB [Sphaerochaeta halotolerans]MXI86938.1 ATP-binding protein [Sphaerochaeta halotolerans]